MIFFFILTHSFVLYVYLLGNGLRDLVGYSAQRLEGSHHWFVNSDGTLTWLALSKWFSHGLKPDTTWQVCRILRVDPERVEHFEVRPLHLDGVINHPGLGRCNCLTGENIIGGAAVSLNEGLPASTHPVWIQHPVTIHGKLVLVVALGQIHNGHKVVLTAEVSVSDSPQIQRASMRVHTPSV